MQLTALVRRHLWSAPAVEPGDAAAHSMRVHLRSVMIVRAYYVVSVLWVAQAMRDWPGLRSSTSVDPLWPAEWIDYPGTQRGITAILAIYGLGALAAMALPHVRLARIAYSFGLFQFLAVDYGFGKINHAYHSWLWVSAFLILLPGRHRAWRSDATADDRQLFVQVIRLAQLCVLFFYTLTGVWKVWHATLALFRPEVSAFELDGFSLLIARNLLSSGRDTVVGDVLASTPVVGWLLFNGTMYLEATSLLVVLRPRLHRLWGFGLILFHLGTQAAMGILFPANIVLVGLLLVCSPVAPERVDWRATVLDLPGVHLAAGQVRAARRRRAGADPPVPATA
ncbi:MAG: hypothetical protein R2702_10530 [Acidimicrobiales bacterium]